MKGKETKLIVVALLALSLLAMPLVDACAKPAPAPAPAPKPAPEKVKLTAVGPWKLDHRQIQFFIKLIDTVNERGAGQLEIEYKGGPELIKAADQLTACGEGTIDMFYSATAYFAGIVPEFGIFGLNMVEWNYDNHPKLRAALKDDLVKITAEKTNTMFLAQFHPLPMVVFTAEKPIKKVADLKGMKIRTAGGWDAAAIEALGAAATKISSAEIYTAAERGIIDGGSRPRSAVVDWREFEVWKYMMTTPVYFNSGGNLFMNLDTYNDLPAGPKKLLLDTIAEWDLEALTTYRQDEQDSIKFLKSQGMEMTELDPGELDKWNAILAEASEAYFLKVAPENGPALIAKLKAAAGK